MITDSPTLRRRALSQPPRPLVRERIVLVADTPPSPAAAASADNIPAPSAGMSVNTAEDAPAAADASDRVEAGPTTTGAPPLVEISSDDGTSRQADELQAQHSPRKSQRTPMKAAPRAALSSSLLAAAPEPSPQPGSQPQPPDAPATPRRNADRRRDAAAAETDVSALQEFNNCLKETIRILQEEAAESTIREAALKEELRTAQEEIQRLKDAAQVCQPDLLLAVKALTEQRSADNAAPYLQAARQGAAATAAPRQPAAQTAAARAAAAPLKSASGRVIDREVLLQLRPDAEIPDKGRLKHAVRQLIAAAEEQASQDGDKQNLQGARSTLVSANYWGKRGAPKDSPPDTVRLLFSTSQGAVQARASLHLWEAQRGWRAKRSPHQVRVHGVVPAGTQGERNGDGLRARLVKENASWPESALQSADWERARTAHGKRKGALNLSFASADAAASVLAAGSITLGGLVYTAVERGGAATRQCIKCYGFGHTSGRCPNTAVCGHCAGSHPTNDVSCRTSRHDSRKCALCQGPHAAYHPFCPMRPGRTPLLASRLSPVGAVADGHE